MRCYKAITTRYCGPTDYRGSRIIASDSDGNRSTLPYPYELSGEACHLKAAEAERRRRARGHSSEGRLNARREFCIWSRKRRYPKPIERPA